MSINIIRVNSLDAYVIDEMVQESVEEGHLFLRKLKEEYDSGTNRFNKPGEALFIVMNDHEIAGIGGLNQDPYINDNAFGRVRHVYVLQKYRRIGIGRVILREIIDVAKKHFSILGLRTENEAADLLYCSLGFIKDNQFAHATHYMVLKE